jgi:soluble lytic murein transglycosylase-like protein
MNIYWSLLPQGGNEMGQMEYERSGKLSSPHKVSVVRSLRVWTLFWCIGAFMAGVPRAEANPIYVFTERDGTIRFTNRPPPASVKAKVFKARSGTFSFVRVTPRRFSSRALLRQAKKYQHIIEFAARTTAVDPALIKAVIHAESAFNPQAVSPKGALGLMQLMPGTARELGVRRPLTAEENIHGGARHLARLLRKYGGNLTFALAAYNAGEFAVERYRGIPPYNETQTYVRRVLALKDQYTHSAKG